MQLTEKVKSTFKDAAKKLTGNRKRDFMAKVSEDYRFATRCIAFTHFVIY